MKKNFEKTIEKVLNYGLVTFIIFIIIYVISIVASRLLYLFGVTYNSVSSIIMYFIIVTAISFPIDILDQIFLKLLMSLEKNNFKIQKTLFIVLDTIGTAIVMAVVDYFMDSVFVPDLVILIISFVMAILSLNKD